MSPEDVYRCNEHVVSREIVGETILVPISGTLANLQDVFSLNPTGAFIWSQLDGKTPLGSVVERLTEGFEVEAEEAWEDLAELVAELAQAGLLEKVDG